MHLGNDISVQESLKLFTELRDQIEGHVGTRLKLFMTEMLNRTSEQVRPTVSRANPTARSTWLIYPTLIDIVTKDVIDFRTCIKKKDYKRSASPPMFPIPD